MIYCGFPFVDLTAIPEGAAWRELDRIETDAPSLIVELTARLDFLDYEPEDPVECCCPCGCRRGIDPPAFQGDRCPMCSEACGPRSAFG